MPKECYLGNEGDISLQLPCFSGNSAPERDEVFFAQWRSTVKAAQFTGSSAAIYS